MPRWTEEARQKQREIIMKSKPWKKSTGPRTPEGKAKSSQNAFRHRGRTKVMEEFRRIIWKQIQYRIAVMAHSKALWDMRKQPVLRENEILSGLQKFYALEQKSADDEGSHHV